MFAYCRMSKFIANEFPIRQSPLLERLRTFLPQISAANDALAQRSSEIAADECGITIERLPQDTDSDSESSDDESHTEASTSAENLAAMSADEKCCSPIPKKAQKLIEEIE